MILLLLALLLLPTAMLPQQEFYPVEKVEVKARDASFPPETRRCLVVIRTGGVSPINTLNVKAYEREGEIGIARLEYIVVFNSRDYVMSKRTVDYQGFERLWLDCSRNRALYLTSPEGGVGKGKPTYTVRIREIHKENTFTVNDPEANADTSYRNVITALEEFWRKSSEF